MKRVNLGNGQWFAWSAWQGRLDTWTMIAEAAHRWLIDQGHPEAASPAAVAEGEV